MKTHEKNTKIPADIPVYRCTHRLRRSLPYRGNGAAHRDRGTDFSQSRQYCLVLSKHWRKMVSATLQRNATYMDRRLGTSSLNQIRAGIPAILARFNSLHFLGADTPLVPDINIYPPDNHTIVYKAYRNAAVPHVCPAHRSFRCPKP